MCVGRGAAEIPSRPNLPPFLSIDMPNKSPLAIVALVKGRGVGPDKMRRNVKERSELQYELLHILTMTCQYRGLSSASDLLNAVSNEVLLHVQTL